MSRALLAQALDALKKYDAPSTDIAGRGCRRPIDDRLCNDIMSFLAQPQAEPVGYVYSDSTNGYTTRHAAVEKNLPNGTPLYATPQQAQPAPAPVVPDGWVSVVDRLPKPGRAVLASMLTPRMLRRTIRAHHSPPHTVDASNWEDETAVDATEDGNAWEPEGWYEDPVIGEMLEFIGVSDGDVTHWMPLPAAPGSAPAVPAVPAVQPLTDTHIGAIALTQCGSCPGTQYGTFYIRFARAIEQAHGISTTGGGERTSLLPAGSPLRPLLSLTLLALGTSF